MKIVSITGELKPKSGLEYDYQIKFDATTTKTKSFHLTTLPSVAFFNLPDGTWNNTIQKTCPEKTNSFTVRLQWTVEKSNVILMVSDDSGEVPSAQLEVNITCEKCTLTTDPSEVKMGTDIICKSELLKRMLSHYSEKQEWSLNNNLMRKEGTPGFEKQQIISQKLKALKVGKTEVSTTFLIVENERNKKFYSEFYKGKLEIEIKSPYNVTIDNGTTFADINSILTYRVNGLNYQLLKETIRWTCNSLGKLISEQGKTPATFQTTSQGNYFEVTAIITVDDQEFRADANKKVWIGKPTVNSSVKSEHSIDAGTELTLKLTEFAHYTGDIEYSVESGMQDQITIEKLTASQYKIKSNHPKIFADTITIRFIASNICGTVSNIHTINIEASLGSDFDKPLPLATIEQHSFYHNLRYALKEYVGDNQSFKMYFTFSLKRKADLRYIAVHTSYDKFQAFKIYDNEKNELYVYTSLDETKLHIEEMKPGKYYLVADVQSGVNDTYLTVEIEGEVKGSYPQSPYIVDVNEEGFEFNDWRDTFFYNQNFYYIDELGNEIRTIGKNNIYYVMTLKHPIQILLHTTGSEVCTEIHMMVGKPFDWKVLYHDAGDAIDLKEIWNDLDLPQNVKNNIWAGQTCIKRIFEPGEYKLVFNAIKKTNGGLYNGPLHVNILGRKVKGQSFDDAYELGVYKEREFKINQVYNDIMAHQCYGINQLYYHFSFEKNVNLSLFAKSDSYYLPIELYNSKREKIASSESDICSFKDAMGSDFYISVNLQNLTNESFSLDIRGVYRGRMPHYDSYNIGSYDNDFTFSDSMDTSDGAFYEFFRYKDENGDYPYISPDSNHIYYKITLLRDMELSIDADLFSKVSTEIHIMYGEPFDWRILYHSMYNGKLNLYAGKYYLVFNGVKMTNGSFRNGLIHVNITGTVL